MIEHVKWALRHGLGGNVLNVLLVLGAYADEEGYCYPGQELIAREVALTSRTVRTIVKLLAERGFIRIEERRRSDGYRSSNGYRLLMTSPEKSSGEMTSPEKPAVSQRKTVSSQEVPVKNQKSVNASATLSPGKGWDRFWDLYPRHIAKDAAHKAWLSALKREKAEVIIAGLERLLPGLMAKEVKFRPYPATWLNAGRWADDVEPPEEPRKPTGTPPRNGGPRVPTQNEWEYNR